MTLLLRLLLLLWFVIGRGFGNVFLMTMKLEKGSFEYFQVFTLAECPSELPLQVCPPHLPAQSKPAKQKTSSHHQLEGLNTFRPLRYTDVSSAKNTLWLPRIHVAAKQLSRLIHPIFPRNLRRRPVFVSQVKVKVINSSHISRNVGRRPDFVYQLSKLSKSESHQFIP